MDISNVGSAIGALKAELREVDRELASYEALREKRKLLLAAIEAAEDVEAMGRPTSTRVEHFRKTVVRQYIANTIPSTEPDTPSEAAIGLLRELGRGVHIRELIALIHGKGWFVDRSYESLRGTIAGTLDARATRGDGILKPEPATYLWDPALGTGTGNDRVDERARQDELGDWRPPLGQHGQQGGQ